MDSQQPPQPCQIRYEPVIQSAPQTYCPSDASFLSQNQSLLSIPSHCHAQVAQKQDVMRTQPNKFFWVQDGVICLSLKDLTLIGCFAVTSTLLYMLYKACSEDMVECTYPVLPMISDVICLPFYDRIFCILTTFFMFTVFQADARAFYHKLQGLASQSQNDWMLFFALIAVFTLPAIGYFDEHNYSTIHGTCAVLFFLSVGVYAWMLANVMSKHKSSFPEEKWGVIDRMKTVRNVMWLCLLGFLAGELFGIDWMIPLMEWLSTLLFLNYFILVSDFDDYYDSVLTPMSSVYRNAVALKA